MLSFRCDSCGKTIRTLDEHAGRRCKCPKCEEVMTIPAGHPIDLGERSVLDLHAAASMSGDKAGQKVAEKSQASDDHDEKEAESRFRFAEVYLSSGKKEKGLHLLQEVIEKYPETEAAEKAHRELRRRGKER